MVPNEVVDVIPAKEVIYVDVKAIYSEFFDAKPA